MGDEPQLCRSIGNCSEGGGLSPGTSVERASPRKLACTSSPKRGGYLTFVSSADGRPARKPGKGPPGSRAPGSLGLSGGQERLSLCCPTCHCRDGAGTASSVPPSLCPLLRVMTRLKDLVA